MSINVNGAKDTNLEFDISINGLGDENSTASVRFVILSVKSYDASFPCTKNNSGKWVVTIPPIGLTESSYEFRIEVVVDEYYFAPAAGTIEVTQEPVVQMSAIEGPSTISKPKVSASIVQPQRQESRAPVKESAQPVDLGTIHFNVDPKFGGQAKQVCGILHKVADVLDGAISEDGVIKDTNKDKVYKALQTGKKSLDVIESKFR